MQDQVTVAAVSVDTCPGALDENLSKIAHWTERAAAGGAQLVLFPELSLTGFVPNHPTREHAGWLRETLQFARSTALRLDGPELKQLARIAARHDVLLCVGLLEDAGNRLFNAQVLVGPAGLVGHWRKMHIPMFEMPFYNGGARPTVVDTPLGRIGVNICFDAFLPESTRLLAVQNVEIVLFPFAADPPPVTPDGWATWAGTALRARCSENGVYGIACNYVGRVTCCGEEQFFPGGGLILDPRGHSLATWSAAAGEPALLLAELSAAQLRGARAEPEYLFRFRRPELYGPLAEI